MFKKETINTFESFLNKNETKNELLFSISLKEAVSDLIENKETGKIYVNKIFEKIITENDNMKNAIKKIANMKNISIYNDVDRILLNNKKFQEHLENGEKIDYLQYLDNKALLKNISKKAIENIFQNGDEKNKIIAASYAKIDNSIFEKYIAKDKKLLMYFINKNIDTAPNLKKRAFEIFFKRGFHNEFDLIKQFAFTYSTQNLNEKELEDILKLLSQYAKRNEKVRYILLYQIGSIFEDKNYSQFVEKKFNFFQDMINVFSSNPKLFITEHPINTIKNEKIFEKYLSIVSDLYKNKKMTEAEISFALDKIENIEAIKNKELLEKFIYLKSGFSNDIKKQIDTLTKTIIFVEMDKEYIIEKIKKGMKEDAKTTTYLIIENLLKDKMEHIKEKAIRIIDEMNEPQFYKEAINIVNKITQKKTEKNDNLEFINYLEIPIDLIKYSKNKNITIENFVNLYKNIEKYSDIKKDNLVVFFFYNIKENRKEYKKISNFLIEEFSKNFKEGNKTIYTSDIIETIVKSPLVEISTLKDFLKNNDFKEYKAEIAQGMITRRIKNIDQEDILQDKELQDYFYDSFIVFNLGKRMQDPELLKFWIKKELEETGKISKEIRENIYFDIDKMIEEIKKRRKFHQCKNQQ